MSKNLLIVESPAKAKTIEKYLGKDFTVKSSYGHIRDLDKGNKSIDKENNFTPKYIVPDDKKKVVSELKSYAKKVDEIWLATDEDREGEAISWHLCEVLGLDATKTKRIVFNEITEKAIKKAVASPKLLDLNLVNAQQARRILDRLVGFELSPVLWRKIQGGPGLSAGRVQSVAVRLVVERERLIEEFKPKITFKVVGYFTGKDIAGNKITFKTDLKQKFKTAEEVEDFLKVCVDAAFKVSNVQVKPAKKSPTAPFTTSTLQQEASRKLGFSVSKTMLVAQKLYEAGKITYMRTDSVNLSQTAMDNAKAAIINKYGENYSEPRKYKNKNSSAQEAHEAIRPSEFANDTAGNTSDEERLYSLIWKRTIASQMAAAQIERTTVTIQPNDLPQLFEAKGEVIQFDGFLKVYQISVDEDEEQEEMGNMLPKVNVGDVLSYKNISSRESFSRSSARYNEATLVKQLEELGIGRPSTYAPTISTIQKRNYVVKENRDGRDRIYLTLKLDAGKITKEEAVETTGAEKMKLFPTDIGKLVSDFLVEHFGDIMNYNFTAEIEKKFDKVAEGDIEWTKMIDNFYHPFHEQVEEATENAERVSGERHLGVDDKTGKNVIVRLGKYGPMVQMGDSDAEEKPKYAKLQVGQTLSNITFDEAMKLFELPKTLGNYENEVIEVNVGRFGPYVKFGTKFISLPKGVDPMNVSMEDAIVVIKEKQKADAPIYNYQGLDVIKGKGRFGPFIKWNSMFINVNKKYDWDTLSEQDIIELIEAKIQKEKDKLIHHWEEDGIRVEKARWKRHNIIQGKIKIELPKTVDAEKLTLEEVKAIIAKNAPKKKTATKKKTTKKKTTAKKK